MGIAPTAGKCVEASIKSEPAGVMGRPSPAGSCWHHASAQKPRQIKRKPPITARDFIRALLRFLKAILSPVSRYCAKHAHQSKSQLFRGLYNTMSRDATRRLATHLTAAASTP